MKERNITFSLLSAIAMVLVILGHLDFNVLTFGGLFPYYSYHVLIFVFISGYFYKPENENHIIKYVIHKFKSLMLPYFIWNVIYGLVTVLLKNVGFEIGGEFNLYNILVAPFVGGHQFMYNAVSWFVPALFMLEICNICARKVMSLAGIRNEWVITALYLIVGILAIYLAIRGSVYDYYKIPGRLMVMAPAFAFGRLYREKLERIDVIPTLIYIPALFLINLVLVLTQGGLNFSVVWVTGFANGPVIPYITTITGIAIWLRVAKLIAAFIEKRNAAGAPLSKALLYFGSNTYSVMMHQLIVFMGIKAIFMAMYDAGTCKDFNITLYRTDAYYTYVPAGMEWMKVLYLLAGIVFPLLLCLCGGKITKIANNFVKKDRT